MWHVWDRDRWVLMYPFMQAALENAWNTASSKEDFDANIFRFACPDDPDFIDKVYMRCRMQVRIYKPKWRVVKVRQIIYYESYKKQDQVQGAASANCNDEEQHQVQEAASATSAPTVS